MSRRKQARPSRAHLEEELVQGPLLINAVGNVNETQKQVNDISESESEVTQWQPSAAREQPECHRDSIQTSSPSDLSRRHASTDRSNFVFYTVRLPYLPQTYGERPSGYSSVPFHPPSVQC
ncbi:hypothetical protein WN48_09074 [Eufriesea mexicana]|uniref:Uncharacterized protein n=1 Tax=Eufriesea mexicana TaxID=516756 RepID=A0A310S7C5_9HYME|nr:hypothetical protein WN48_09074 [Eufriesea mexicana]